MDKEKNVNEKSIRKSLKSHLKVTGKSIRKSPKSHCNISVKVGVESLSILNYDPRKF